MDNSALDFARKILASLALIVDLLGRSSNRPNTTERSVAHKNISQHESGSNEKTSLPALRAELKLPSALIEEYSTSNRNDEKLQRKLYRTQIGLLVATLLAFIATAAYVIISGRQLSMMQTNFVKDQRPYVMITGVTQHENIPIAPNAPMVWDVKYLNFGHTPAVQVEGNAQVQFGETAKADMESYFKRLPQIFGKGVRNFYVLAPNGLGDHGFTSVVSRHPLTNDEFLFITTHESAIFIALGILSTRT